DEEEGPVAVGRDLDAVDGRLWVVEEDAKPIMGHAVDQLLVPGEDWVAFGRSLTGLDVFMGHGPPVCSFLALTAVLVLQVAQAGRLEEPVALDGQSPRTADALQLGEREIADLDLVTDDQP